MVNFSHGLLALCYGAPYFWTAAQVIAGTSAATYVLWWGERFRMAVPFSKRGRVLAAGMILANVLYAVSILMLPYIGLHAIATSSVVMLAMAGLASAQAVAVGAATHRITSAPSPTKRSDFGKRVIPWLGVTVLAFYLVGGLYYDVTLPHFNQVPLDKSVQVIPYVVAVWIAGRLADSRGRRFLATAAVLAMGTSYALAPLLPPLARYFGSLFMINVSFAAFDLFLWLTLADMSDSRSPIGRTGGDWAST